MAYETLLPAKIQHCAVLHHRSLHRGGHRDRDMFFNRKLIEMIETISHREPIARKDYPCMASEFLRDLGFCRSPLTFSELRKVVVARRNGWMIKKGTPYVYQFNKYDGDRYVFRAIKDIHEICLKYDVYPY